MSACWTTCAFTPHASCKLFGLLEVNRIAVAETLQQPFEPLAPFSGELVLSDLAVAVLIHLLEHLEHLALAASARWRVAAAIFRHLAHSLHDLLAAQLFFPRLFEEPVEHVLDLLRGLCGDFALRDFAVLVRVETFKHLARITPTLSAPTGSIRSTPRFRSSVRSVCRHELVLRQGLVLVLVPFPHQPLKVRPSVLGNLFEGQLSVLVRIELAEQIFRGFPFGRNGTGRTAHRQESPTGPTQRFHGLSPKVVET